MKDKLTNSESEDLKSLNTELFSPTTIDKFSGSKTRKIMKILDVESPSTDGAICISKNPVTYVVPNEVVDDSNREEWIRRMQKKFRVN